MQISIDSSDWITWTNTGIHSEQAGSTSNQTPRIPVLDQTWRDSVW